MATYQILYWNHIPLSVRAADETGIVSQPLSGRFVEALQNDTEDYKLVMHSSNFKWSKEQERAGTAAEVTAAIVQELTETWNEKEALILFTSGKL